MKPLLVLVTALFLSIPAIAYGPANVSFEGVFVLKHHEPHLRLKSNKTVRIAVNDNATIRDLQKLQPGDYLTGTGILDSAQETLILDSIETVGLRSLLGRWQAADGQIFEFQDFDSLRHYTSLIMLASTRSNARDLSYSLAPDSVVNRWSIFLTDQTMLLIGSVEFTERSIKLILMNPQNGQIVERLELKPIQVQ